MVTTMKCLMTLDKMSRFEAYSIVVKNYSEDNVMNGIIEIINKYFDMPNLVTRADILYITGSLYGSCWKYGGWDLKVTYSYLLITTE